MTVNRSNYVFITIVIVGLIIWLQASLLLLHELFNYHVFPNGFDFHSASKDHSRVYSILSMCFNAIIIFSLAMVILRLTVECIDSVRWNKLLHSQKHKMLSHQLMSEYADWQIPIIVIHNEDLIALTYGFLRPKIIVSSGVINRLNDNDLKSVLLFQYNHCKSYNPLRSLIAWFMKESLPFIPIQRDLFHYLRVWMELQADRYTIDKMETMNSNINFILLTRQHSPEALQYRIRQFQKKGSNIQVPFWSVRSLVISFSMIALLSIIVLGSIGS
jgi:hypothetical protein